MKRTYLAAMSVFVLLVCLPALAGQQPNSASASLTVNGVNGPPFPMAVTLAAPPVFTLALRGPIGAPWMIAMAAPPVSPGVLVLPGPPPLLFNSVDILGPPLFVFTGVIGPGGVAVVAAPVTPAFSGMLLAVQGAVLLNPGPPAAFVLSAAASIVFL